MYGRFFRMISANKQHKGYYSETEAAAALGVSVEELRSLIRDRIVQREEELVNVPSAYFQPSDILMLRLLLSGLAPPEKTETPSA
jgi:hypothetical protein